MSKEKKIVTLLSNGVKLYNDGKFEDSIKVFIHVDKVLSGVPDSYYWIYKNYDAMGEKTKAKEYFKKALDIIHIIIYKNDKNKAIFEQWLEEYERVYNKKYLINFVKHNVAIEKKVENLLIKKQQKEALATINKTKKLSIRLLNDKFNILRLNLSTEVFDILGYIIKNNEDEIELILDIADFLLELQYNYLSSTLYNAVLTNNPDNVVVYLKLANMAVNVRGDFKLAKKYALKALDLDNENISVRITLLGIYSQMGDYNALYENLMYIKENKKDIDFCKSFLPYLEELELDICKDVLTAENTNVLSALSIIKAQLSNGLIENAIKTKEYILTTDKADKYSSNKTKNKLLQNRLDNINNVVSFFSPGRGGSYFFHSLIDGHQEVATIPGAFLKGFFDYGVFNMFLSGSKKDFVKKFMNIYEAMFDAKSYKSVPGDPMGGTGASQLAKTCGLTTLGKDRDTFLQIDKEKFEKLLLEYIEDFKGINEKDLFKLIHLVWEELRGDDIDKKRTIFYHIHNPNIREYYRFFRSFEDNKPLYIVRNSLQGLESWMSFHTMKNINVQNMDYEDRLDLFNITYSKMVGKIKSRLFQNRDIVFISKHAFAVRLEDVKRKPEATMRSIAKMMNIEYSDSLLKSQFMGLDFHSNASKLNKDISAFDTKSIDRKTGILFSENDSILLNTLLKPWNERYEYDEGDYPSVSIEEALIMNEDIMDWEKKVIELCGVKEEDAMKSIKFRIQKCKLALQTQDQIREELKKITLIKPEL